MQADKRTLLWSAAFVVASSIVYRPRLLATLLLSPLYAIGTFLVAVVIHTALAYGADRIDARRAKAVGNPVVPLLSIATPAGLEAIRVKKAWSRSNTEFRVPLHPGSSKASAALDDLIATILDNHLLSWYTVSISPSDPSFPHAVEKVIREVLGNAREYVAAVDWARLGVSTLLPKITTHLELFLEAQQSLVEASGAPKVGGQNGGASHQAARGKKQSPGANVASEELDLLLANKYAELAGKKGLHPAVSGASFNSRPTEEKHLRDLVHRILNLVMPSRESASPAVLTMATEIVACAIVRPVIEALTDPDLWNKIIDEKAGAIIREQRMVNKLREALDANSNTPQTPRSALHNQTGDISTRTTNKEFEAFLKSLGRCPSLLEAKRLRNDIETDLRKTKLPDSLSEEPAALLTRYIERLTTARQVIDKRISELGGQTIPLSTTPASTTGTLVLRDILHQPGAMSFFMEFMDRRHRAMLPQFYLTIEGLKNPLEEEHLEDEEMMRSSFVKEGSYIDAKTAQALRDDCQLLISTFLLPKIVNVSSNIVEALQAFQEQESAKTGESMTKALYRNTRRHIFAAQMQCYDEMAETDWPSFRRSDLYNRAAAEIPRPTLHSTRTEISRNRPVTRPRALSQEPEITFPLAATTRPTDGHTTGLRPQTTNLGLPQPSNGDTSSRRRGREDSAGYKTDKIDFLTGVVANSPSSVEAQRSPLFREDADLQSQASFNIIVEDAETVQQQQTMEAIQEALTSILEDDTRRRSVTVPASPTSIRSRDSTDSSPARVLLQQRATSPILQQTPKNRVASGTSYKERPGLHGRMASYHSEQNDLSSEVDAEEKLSDDEDMTSSALRLAAPGNLELPAEIEKIASRIEKLKNQEGVLDALLRKADLTGNKDETKILMKSIDALRREISELSFQRRQFEAQAHENKLVAGRTSVEVIGTTMGRSQGKEFALYLVEVRQLAEDGQTQISGWLVTRRFSEFVALHATLKDKLPGAKALDLPQKRLVTSMSNTLLQQRKQGLSRYLQALIKLPGALTNRDVEAFLSQQNITLLQPSNNSAISVLGSDIFPGQGVIRNLFRTVTSGMDDMFGGPSMLDAIILRLSQQAADFAGNLTPSVQSEDLISSILGGFSTAASGRSAGAENDQVDLLAISTDFQPVDGEGLTSFTAPIANFLVEVFDLKEKGSWLRRQAIVIILQQVLGGTIERKVREAVDLSTTGDALATHLNQLREMMWPGGQMRPQSLPRGADEKAQTREAAFRKLTYLMPDVAASLIGRSNARRGARRIFAMIQNRRLLQHLIYTLLDDIVNEIFGDALSK